MSGMIRIHIKSYLYYLCPYTEQEQRLVYIYSEEESDMLTALAQPSQRSQRVAESEPPHRTC